MKKWTLIIMATSLLFLISGCGGNQEKITSEVDTPQTTQKEETYENELLIIDRNTSNTFKGENYSASVRDDDKDGKYEVSIALDANDNRFNEAIWCAINGLDEIDGIKRYNSEFDEKVSVYNLSFFAEGSEKYSAIVDNSRTDIESINLTSDTTGETTVITRQDIVAYQENKSKEEKNDDVPTEYKSALKKAKIYSDTMHMSKSGIYNQLTSEYGEKFTAEAAQYAIDNVQADWKANALKKAKTYQENMAMSPSAIYDQLISEYGEKFTPEEAQYAIDNLN